MDGVSFSILTGAVYAIAAGLIFSIPLAMMSLSKSLDRIAKALEEKQDNPPKFQV